MTRLTRKYEFVDQAAADAAIALLPQDEEGNPTGEHLVTILGFILLVPATYDDEGHELTPPVYSDKYAVDIYWGSEALESWEPYIVWPLPMGVHTYGSSSSRNEYEATYCGLFPESEYCNPPLPPEPEELELP
jgi:hypothetical protein